MDVKKEDSPRTVTSEFVNEALTETGGEEKREIVVNDSINTTTNTPQPRFRTQNTYEIRKEVAGKIREQYPDRYPVIVELDPRATKSLVISKKKFLAPGDIPLNKFMLEVRKVIRMGRQDPLAVMIESGQMVSGDSKMSDLYNSFKDPDGFLYILFSGDV
jgi:hypothetical protein